MRRFLDMSNTTSLGHFLMRMCNVSSVIWGHCDNPISTSSISPYIISNGWLAKAASEMRWHPSSRKTWRERQQCSKSRIVRFPTCLHHCTRSSRKLGQRRGISEKTALRKVVAPVHVTDVRCRVRLRNAVASVSRFSSAIRCNSFSKTSSGSLCMSRAINRNPYATMWSIQMSDSNGTWQLSETRVRSSAF